MSGAKHKVIARLKAIWDLLYAAGEKWCVDNVPRLSAAISFFAALSLAPFLVIGAVIAVYFVGTNPNDHFSLVGQARLTLGNQAAELIHEIVLHAREQHSDSVIASLISFAIMFFGASHLFLQFDDAVRSVWGVQLHGTVVRMFIRSRLTAFASVILFGLALIAWLYIDARMAYMAGQAFELRLSRFVSFLSSFAVLSVACSISMKRHTDVKLSWPDVLPGAMVAGFLISVAKYLLSLYFSRTGVWNIYGPAGALVVILLWIYYCCQIYFYGLEIVCVYSGRYGSRSKGSNSL